MKRLPFAATLLTLTMSTCAQDEAEAGAGDMHLEVEFAVDVPMFGFDAGLGVDAGANLCLALSDRWIATVGFDVIPHLERRDERLVQVPITLGARYQLDDLYVFGQAGLNIINTSSDAVDGSTTSTVATNIGIGYALGPVNFIGSVMVSDIEHPDETIQVLNGLQLPFVAF